ncbi:hypothetical protein C8R46DRAFT_512010, partial [Mycena filopes]
MRPAHQIYSSQLSEFRHGYALWCPEPCLYTEVKVGDIGYLRDGAFHRLFNATLPAEHPDQTLGVPALFQPLILPTGSSFKLDKFLDPGNIRSSSVSEYRYGVDINGVVLPGGAGVHFSCSRRQGALLHLSKPAIREEALAREAFETYILRNFPQWYDFANAVLFRGVKNGEIMLVTGCDKTMEWSSAVFDERCKDAGISLQAQGAIPGLSASVTFSGKWDTTSSIQHRSGPIQDCDPPKVDQTIFIRGYKILERRIRTPKVIRAAAEPRSPSSSDDENEPGSGSLGAQGTITLREWSLESIPGESLIYHPSDALLEYILAHSDEAVALVHDDYWCDSTAGPRLPDDSLSVQEIIDAYRNQFFANNLPQPEVDWNPRLGHATSGHFLPSQMEIDNLPNSSGETSDGDDGVHFESASRRNFPNDTRSSSSDAIGTQTAVGSASLAFTALGAELYPSSHDKFHFRFQLPRPANANEMVGASIGGPHNFSFSSHGEVSLDDTPSPPPRDFGDDDVSDDGSYSDNDHTGDDADYHRNRHHSPYDQSPPLRSVPEPSRRETSSLPMRDPLVSQKRGTTSYRQPQTSYHPGPLDPSLRGQSPGPAYYRYEEPPPGRSSADMS